MVEILHVAQVPVLQRAAEHSGTRQRRAWKSQMANNPSLRNVLKEIQSV